MGGDDNDALSLDVVQLFLSAIQARSTLLIWRTLRNMLRFLQNIGDLPDDAILATIDMEDKTVNADFILDLDLTNQTKPHKTH